MVAHLLAKTLARVRVLPTKHTLPLLVVTWISPRARAGCCAVVEVEGAFFIGLVSATNYLMFSRFLELVHIDDMVSAARAPTGRVKNGDLLLVLLCNPVCSPLCLFLIVFSPAECGENNLSLVTSRT